MVGRSVFLFKVLPETNPLTAVVIGTAVCQVPGILKLTSLCLLRNTPQSEDTTSHRWLRVRRLVHAPLVALALAVQLGAVPVLYYNSRITSSSGLQLPPVWCLVVTAACSSLGWWENYAYGRDVTHRGTKHKAQQGLSKWRAEMGRVRQTSFVYTGPVQMTLLLALFFQFNGDADVDVFQQIAVLLRSLGQGLSDGRVLSSHFTAYALLYLQVGGTLVTCFLSGIACRLYMQRLAFAAPVLLVAPAAMALTLVCTPASLLHWYDASQACRSLNPADPGTTLLLLLGVAVWLSTLIINTHIWFPQVERMAKMERSVLAGEVSARWRGQCLLERSVFAGEVSACWRGQYLLERSGLVGEFSVCWRCQCLLERSGLAGEVSACWRGQCLLEWTVLAGKVNACWRGECLLDVDVSYSRASCEKRQDGDLGREWGWWRCLVCERC